MKPRPFSDVEFGEELELEPDVSLENVRRFAEVANMVAPRFLDHEEARKQGLPGAIVPGIMSQGILAALVHRMLPGCQLEKIDTIFRAPLLVDSKPTCRGVITNLEPDERVVELDLTITNEDGETRVLGTALARLPV